MPGMVKADTSPLSGHSTVSQSSLSPPLGSFSSLSLSSLSNVVSPQHSQLSPQQALLQDIKSEDRGLWLIQLLLRCANSVVCGNMEHTNLCLEQLSLLASLTGDPMQRVATYFMSGMATRITKSWPGLYKALNSTHLSSIVDLLSARQVFFNLCPYLKFAYTTVNQAILDAMEGEKVVHLIDLGSLEAVQWIALLQSFSTRPEGPPHLRITVINERKELLDQTGQRLSEEAERLDIPFQFHAVVAKLEDLDADLLKVKTGEAVGVSSVLQLHLYLAEDDRPGSQGRSTATSGLGQVGSSFGLYGGSPQVDDSPGSLSQEMSPISTGSLRSLQYKEGRGNFFQHFNMDERGIKRGRDEAFKNNHRSTYGVATTVIQERNGELTLGELFAREKDEASQPYRNGNGYYPRMIDTEGDMYRNGRSTLFSTGDGSPTDFPSGTVADRLLQILRTLCPKIMVVVEQDSNHNSPILVERFVEALHYYCAMFDSLESTLPQHSIDRVTLEKHLFGQEIQNIVACEGSERVERHEKLERWRKRMEKAGFLPVSFSYSTFIQAKRLLLSYSCEGHRLLEDRGCLRVCWQETPLFSASAWQV
eukprot:c27574_g1_i1 orf=939-2711(+)